MSGVNRAGEKAVVREVQKTKPAPTEATQAPKTEDTATPAMPADDVKLKTKKKPEEGVKLFDQPANPKDDKGNVIYKSPDGDVQVTTHADGKVYEIGLKIKF